MATLFDLSPNAFLREQKFNKSEKEKLLMFMQVSSKLMNVGNLQWDRARGGKRAEVQAVT